MESWCSVIRMGIRFTKTIQVRKNKETHSAELTHPNRFKMNSNSKWCNFIRRVLVFLSFQTSNDFCIFIAFTKKKMKMNGRVHCCWKSETDEQIFACYPHWNLTLTFCLFHNHIHLMTEFRWTWCVLFVFTERWAATHLL